MKPSLKKKKSSKIISTSEVCLLQVVDLFYRFTLWADNSFPLPGFPEQCLPLSMAGHATAHHGPKKHKPDVGGCERGQQGEVGTPQEGDEQNLDQQKRTCQGTRSGWGMGENPPSHGDFSCPSQTSSALASQPTQRSWPRGGRSPASLLPAVTGAGTGMCIRKRKPISLHTGCGLVKYSTKPV